MCFFYGVSKNKKEIEKKMNAKFSQVGFQAVSEVNGFAHPFMPIITNEHPDFITAAKWGLLPTWAKDTALQKKTLNARIETIADKPSFKESVNNRCIIPATNFYEWKWLDEKGKKKQKYSIGVEGEDIFCFAGLYSIWWHTNTGEPMLTYTILTTEANKLMSEIHNTKKRMPVVLNSEHHKLWLQGENYKDFAFPYEVKLTAHPV